MAKRLNINILANEVIRTREKINANILASKIDMRSKKSNINKMLEKKLSTNWLITYMRRKNANIIAIIYDNAIFIR